MTINPASQVIAALLIGLLIVFTCQLLLMNLGLALGITIWGGFSREQANESDSEDKGVDSKSDAIGLETLSIAAGLGLLLTVNGVLFVACYGAVKFCAPTTAFAGAVLGCVVWSAYMLIMTWVSTRAANSLVAFIFSSAVSGLRQIFAVLDSLVQSTLGNQEAPLTPSATAELVRQETQQALEKIDIPILIEEYIDEQMLPQLQLETLQPQLENTLQQSNLGGAERRGFLSQINLSTFAQWVKDEIGLSGDVADAIADVLNQVWQRIVSNDASPWQELQALFSTASVEELIPKQVNHVLERLLQDSSYPSEPFISQSPHQLTRSESSENANSTNGISRQLKRILRQRLDLTDLDIQTIWSRISPLLPDWQPGTNTSLDLQIIHEDVDDYLQQVFPWRLNHETLQQEFREVLVDPDAAADQILPQLQRLSPEDFAHSLKQRGDLAAEQIDELLADLETIRQSAIVSLRESTTVDQNGEAGGEPGDDTQDGTSHTSEYQTEAIAELQQKLENYLHYTSLSQITSDAIAHKVETLVEESPLPTEILRQASPHLPKAPLTKVLDRRQGLDSAQQDYLIQQVQAAWQHSTTSETKASNESISTEAVVAIEGVLILTISQITIGHVDTQDLLPKLMASLEKVTSDPQKLRRSLNQIDWQALRQSAQTQLDVSEAQVEQAVLKIQAALMGFLKPPKRWALRRSAEIKGFWDNVTEYLSQGHPDQLLPAAIRHNLAWLWQASNQALEPLQGLQAETIAEISSVDWDGIKEVLVHRQDLAADQIEVIWEVLERFIQSLLHQANQAREQVQASVKSWLESIKDILQDPEQLAFDPNRLKADLRALLQHPSDVFAALLQPLKLLNVAEDSAAAIAQLSQDALKQLLRAQGVPKALLTQAEGLQTWMQARLTAVEQDIQQRQAAIKQNALQQLDDARKALATAAWWLFAIAFTSGTTATVAGILAVTGFKII